VALLAVDGEGGAGPAVPVALEPRAAVAVWGVAAGVGRRVEVAFSVFFCLSFKGESVVPWRGGGRGGEGTRIRNTRHVGQGRERFVFFAPNDVSLLLLRISSAFFHSPAEPALLVRQLASMGATRNCLLVDDKVEERA
jgi:hypothetical protein